jgi:hypothetical protein
MGKINRFALSLPAITRTDKPVTSPDILFEMMPKKFIDNKRVNVDSKKDVLFEDAMGTTSITKTRGKPETKSVKAST